MRPHSKRDKPLPGDANSAIISDINWDSPGYDYDYGTPFDWQRHGTAGSIPF